MENASIHAISPSRLAGRCSMKKACTAHSLRSALVRGSGGAEARVPQPGPPQPSLPPVPDGSSLTGASAALQPASPRQGLLLDSPLLPHQALRPIACACPRPPPVRPKADRPCSRRSDRYEVRTSAPDLTAVRGLAVSTADALADHIGDMLPRRRPIAPRKTPPADSRSTPCASPFPMEQAFWAAPRSERLFRYGREASAYRSSVAATGTTA